MYSVAKLFAAAVYTVLTEPSIICELCVYFKGTVELDFFGVYLKLSVAPFIFGLQRFRTVKWPPKSEEVTEKLKKNIRGSFSLPDLTMQPKKAPQNLVQFQKLIELKFLHTEVSFTI